MYLISAFQITPKKHAITQCLYPSLQHIKRSVNATHNGDRNNNTLCYLTVHNPSCNKKETKHE